MEAPRRISNLQGATARKDKPLQLTPTLGSALRITSRVRSTSYLAALPRSTQPSQGPRMIKPFMEVLSCHLRRSLTELSTNSSSWVQASWSPQEALPLRINKCSSSLTTRCIQALEQAAPTAQRIRMLQRLVRTRDLRRLLTTHRQLLTK
jgi:hypothetical protein